MSEFANRLKKFRTEKKFTQKELATILNVSQNAVYNWENEKREPSIDMITKIANALEVTEQELLGYNDNAFILYQAVEEMKNLENVDIKKTDDIHVFDGVLISDQKLLSEYHLLNTYGKKEAITRVSELKYIPGYTGEDDIPFNS